MENMTSGDVVAPPSLPICLEDKDVDLERHNKFMETQNVDGINHLVSNPNFDLIAEPTINMDTSDAPGTQKRQIY